EHNSEIAWWRFDEAPGSAILDSSGHGNNGRILSGVQRVPGIHGGALQFDGSGDAVSGRPNGPMPLEASPRTIAAWIKTDSTNGDFTSILHYGANGLTPPAANFGASLSPDGRIQAGNGFNNGI